MYVRPLFSAAMVIAVTSMIQPLVQAQPKAAQLLPIGSEISFTTRQMGVPVEGKFGKFSANISLNPKTPQTGNVAFSIDTGSARFGSAELDAEVPKAIWLNVVKFPQADFQSTSIKAVGGGKFEVSGKLNIKGAVRDVVLPVQLTQAGGNSTAIGSLTIKRLEFKVGEGEWADTSLVANEVLVKFKLQIAGLGPL
jgi:polyisoprenoid-binding protein YceI